MSEKRTGAGTGPAARSLGAHLDRAVARTRLAIALERLARRFWPAATVLMFIFAALRLDLLALLPDRAQLPALALAALAALGLVVHGALRLRLPSRAEALARIDAALPGRPLRALSDRQATGRDDPAARAVWAAHMARLARRAMAARAARPDPGLAARDPLALRHLALVLALAGLVFGRGEVAERLPLPLTRPAEAAMQSGPVLEAWATPPAYTGKPTLYLTDPDQPAPIALPQGTVLTLRLYGAEEASLDQTLHAGPAPVPFAPNAQGFRAAEFPVDSPGRLSVTADGRRLVAWTFEVVPDRPPSLRLLGPPEPMLQGAGRYRYAGQDDYGLVAAWATVTLDLSRVARRHGLAPDPEPRPPVEFDLPLPLTGDARDFEETGVVDLSTHPWAGLPVRIVLHGRDGAGQETRTEAHEVVLPGRRFFEPLAAAVAEQRRDLLWTLANAPRVTRLLKALTHAPEEGAIPLKAHLVLRTAIRRLDYARAEGRVAQVRDDVAELLWRAALLIEDGDIADARERLRRAQDRLSRAIEEGASEQEIAELMDELRQAMQQFLQELMRQALEEMQQGDPDRQAEAPPPDMTTRDLEEMLDRLQQLMQEGRMAEAQELLDQLRRMMENLQLTLRPGQPQDGGPGQQMMQGLQDLMRRQQELGDRTFEELQRRFGQGDRPGEPRPGGPGTGELSREQEALRQLLEEFRQSLPGLPALPGQDDPVGEARRALEEAERQMGEARDRLQADDPGGAVDDQAEALDALREGMRNLSEAQRQAQMRDGPRDGMQATETPGQQRDPLGRPVGQTGQIDGADVRIPGSEAWKRSRELREEILRRSGEQDRPKLELDYLRRLLERF
ncbi:MAG: TIGR02302 family protein [Alphaproteobacteria bacterium]|nr:MAG: TIGR02302 family protein [Alphaproteobacteria bacterium]